MSFITELKYLAGSSGDRVLDLGQPAICAGCYRTGSALCQECRFALDVRSRTPGVPIGLPADRLAPLLQLEWCAPLTGIASRAIHQLTDAGERRIGVPLGQVLANRWAVAGAGGEVLVPIPASIERARACGYDHSALLARGAGHRLHMPVLDVLVRTRQAVGLDHEVSAGVADLGFAVINARRIVGRWAILVDDVVTTGATMTACANLLLRAGARAVSGLVVARDRTIAADGDPRYG